MVKSEDSGWHSDWEKNIYSNNRHLNLYPYHAVVGFVLSNFGKEKRENINILEIGFGAGNNLWFAAREGFNVFGIEGSKSAVEFCKKRFLAENLKGDFRIGDFQKLPWDENRFDFILDKMALEYNRKDTIENLLKEANRVLKTKGKILSIFRSYEHPDRIYGTDLGDNSFDNFNEGYFKGLGIVHFTTMEEIRELFGKYFTVNTLQHTLEYDSLTNKLTNAFYKIECTKE